MTNWKQYTRTRVKDPKLSYLERRLDAAGVGYFRSHVQLDSRRPVSAILMVEASKSEAAWTILQAPIDPPDDLRTVEDLPDTDPWFTRSIH